MFHVDVVSYINNFLGEVLTYYSGMVPGDMYGALTSKNVKTFWHTMIKGTLLYIGKVLVSQNFFKTYEHLVIFRY